MNHNALNAGLTLLIMSVLLVWLAKRLNLSSIIGYLLVGVIIGPFALNWLPENEDIKLLAEIGIVFLLFMIGLDFSISHLIAMKNIVFGLGSVQVIISALSGAFIAWLTGISWEGALVVGGGLALSSTAIVAKQLSEQLEMQGRHGKLSISILLFQDLAVVPLLVIIPILATKGEQSITLPILISLGKGILALFIMLQIGRWLLLPYYHIIAAIRSAEMFTLATLFIALAAAWLTHQLGLSLALGAFLAGLMLSETEYKRQIQADIRPFRDVLMGIFFITVGAQLNISIIFDEWFWVALLTSGIIIGKGTVIFILTRIAGYETPVAFRTGLILGQTGEFGFAIFLLAINNELLTLQETQPIIAASLLSMLITSLLIRYNRQIVEILFKKRYVSGANVPIKQIDKACKSLNKHVIICGFGYIGQSLSSILRKMNVDYIALDLNHSLIKEAWEAGEKVFYADASKLKVLKKIRLKKSSAVIITLDDTHMCKSIISSVRSINKKIPIITRCKDSRHMKILHEIGADNVIPESFEAGMTLTIQLLQHLGLSTKKYMKFLEQTRLDKYKEIHGFFRGEETLGVEELDVLQLHTITLLTNSYAVGKNIKSLCLDKLNVNIVAVRRGTNRVDNINEQFVFSEGDTIVVEGLQTSILNAEKFLMAR